MELKRAKEVLEEYGITITKKELKNCWKNSSTITVHPGKVRLDVFFHSPEPLEAITTWMRDPEGVVKA